MRKGFILPVIGLLVVMINGAQLLPVGQPTKVHLNVIKRVPLDYYLLTREQPLTFNISAVSDTGTWLRVYTRLWWQNRQGDKAAYSILCIQDGQRQRFRLVTERSHKTLGPAGQYLGKWRSFFVKLKSDSATFKLMLDSGQLDTVAVRLAFEAPAVWKTVEVPHRKRLTIVVRQETTTVRRRGYYQIARDEPIEVDVSGSVRVRVRLNFDPTMRGEQVFGIAVEENGAPIAERSFRVKKALGARYEEVSDVVPSVERVLRFDLNPGVHRLKIILQGTTAKGGALIVERLVKGADDESE
ncbi:MAG: hypothetical protein K6T77_06020 [candidate division WOR-3 bacterium]|jgi:hypothetical protein|nr:hypothetical protein [candidate division WOR-3 bacterium]MCR4423189.1 hypothetical protein [candidate division WOR-3 bacterium]MDH7518528.1 hypothetical protein [bacterium]